MFRTCLGSDSIFSFQIKFSPTFPVFTSYEDIVRVDVSLQWITKGSIVSIEDTFKKRCVWIPGDPILIGPDILHHQVIVF